MRRSAVLCLALAALAAPGRADTPQPVSVVVADFDDLDSSGESGDRAAGHAALVRGFARRLGDAIVATGAAEARPLACGRPPCSAGAMPAATLIDAARRDGARLLVYGGIHKMSTLVQWGRVQVVDLERDTLLLDLEVSFRGDDAAAFGRAAAFVGRSVADAVARR